MRVTSLTGRCPSRTNVVNRRYSIRRKQAIICTSDLKSDCLPAFQLATHFKASRGLPFAGSQPEATAGDNLLIGKFDGGLCGTVVKSVSDMVPAAHVPGSSGWGQIRWP